MIKALLALGDRYAARSSWKDFALVKFCLFSMGLIAGTMIPKEKKGPVTAVAAAIFAASYVPLMAKLFSVAAEKDE